MYPEANNIEDIHYYFVKFHKRNTDLLTHIEIDISLES